MGIETATLISLNGYDYRAAACGAAVGIGDTTGIFLNGRGAGSAAAMRVEAAAFLLPETVEEAPQLRPELGDERDDRGGGPFLGARSGLRGHHRRRGEDRGKEEDEGDALREGATKHRGPFRRLLQGGPALAARAPLQRTKCVQRRIN